MGKPETIWEYLIEVERQIRWKRARPGVSGELEGHLEDQRDAFLAEGHSPEQAERLAVAEMGDPVTVGGQLDLVHRPRAQWGLLGLTTALAVLGVALRLTVMDSNQYTAIRAGTALFLGCVSMVGLYFVDHARLARHGRALWPMALLAGIWTLATSPLVGGASYYTRILVLLYPTVYAFWVYSWRNKGWPGLICALLGGGPLLLVAATAPSMLGMLLLLTVGSVLLLLAARADLFGVGKIPSTLAILAVGAVLLIALLPALLSRPYILRRLDLVFHPELDPIGAGYQAMTTRSLLSSAQWFGQGTLGVGDQRAWDFLTGQSDLLLAAAVFRFGWLPVLLILAALAALILALLGRCMKQKSLAGRLTVTAVALTMALELGLSVAANLGWNFCSSVTPLFMGNLQTVLHMALIGVALSVFRGDAITRETAPVRYKFPWRIVIERVEG